MAPILKPTFQGAQIIVITRSQTEKGCFHTTAQQQHGESVMKTSKTTSLSGGSHWNLKKPGEKLGGGFFVHTPVVTVTEAEHHVVVAKLPNLEVENEDLADNRLKISISR